MLHKVCDCLPGKGDSGTQICPRGMLTDRSRAERRWVPWKCHFVWVLPSSIRFHGFWCLTGKLCFLIFFCKTLPKNRFCYFLLFGEAFVFVEHKSKEEELMELVLFSRKERKSGGTLLLPTTTGCCRQVGVNLFFQVTNDRSRGNGFQLHQGRFRSDSKKSFFTERVVKY